MVILSPKQHGTLGNSEPAPVAGIGLDRPAGAEPPPDQGTGPAGGIWARSPRLWHVLRGGPGRPPPWGTCGLLIRR